MRKFNISTPGKDFEDAVSQAIEELIANEVLLKDEIVHLINVNSLLINMNRALKEILIKKNIFNDKEFEKIFNRIDKESRQQFMKDLKNRKKQNEKSYQEYLLTDEYPANA